MFNVNNEPWRKPIYYSRYFLQRAIHESSRIATEIITLEAKLTSLNSIRNTFTGDAAALAKLDPLSKHIDLRKRSS